MVHVSLLLWPSYVVLGDAENLPIESFMYDYVLNDPFMTI